MHLALPGSSPYSREMVKKALGRGLSALISTKPPSAAPVSVIVDPEPAAGERVEELPIDSIIPSPLQPRRSFPEALLEELRQSIEEHGILQPLILRRNRDGRAELIAGERRWRAARMAGLKVVPGILREVADRDVLELALIENLQRSDLNPIEEAEAYRRLAGEFSLRQEDIAKRVGRSRAAVANAMRLLELDEQLRGFLACGRLSVGHAKVLLAVPTQEEQRLLADQVLRKSMTVRETEALVQAHLRDPVARPPGGHAKAKSGTGPLSPVLHDLQNRLRNRLATHVALKPKGSKGTIEIEYYGNDDLQRLLDLLGVDPDA